MATINGTTGDDRNDSGLVGGPEDDLIQGFEGRDDLTGNAGNDTLDGGEGDRDAAVYRTSPTAIVANLTTGTVSDGFGGTDTLINIERIEGSDFNDTLTGADSGDTTRLSGGDGDDVLLANITGDTGGSDLDGGNGNDTLTSIGGEFSFMQPGAGDDVINGASSFDIISYFFNAGYDDPPATQGITATFTAEGDGTVIDYRGDTDTFTDIERIEGTMFADTFIGAEGGQSFRGTGGNDTMDGGAGDDEVNYDGSRDDFAEESGVIVDLEAGTAQDKFGDTDTLISIERVRGSDFDDQITGSSGDNRLRAEDGNDTITGAAGDDRIEGGNGIDTAVFEGDQSNFTLTISNDETVITDRSTDGEGTDSLSEIEILDFGTELALFGEGPVNIDSLDDGTSLSAEEYASIVELYIAYFNRAPDAIGLNFWASAFARGEVDLAGMAELFFDQAETRTAYATALNEDGSQITDVSAFVIAIYTNVLGREPDAGGRDFWIGVLERGEVTPGSAIGSIIAGAKADAPSDATQEEIDARALDQQYLANATDIGVHFAVINGMSDTTNASTVMELLTRSSDSVSDAVAQSNQFLSEAQAETGGEFLMQLVGVIDDPFAA